MTTVDSKSLHVPLQIRPTATSFAVRSLVESVAQGKIRVPSFQRPLRWRVKDVVNLLDSLWRGYPIGSLLFWKRLAPADSELMIGSAKLNVDSRPDALWIVDGQQRTTALAAALLDLNHGSDKRWTIHFDPESQTFQPGRPTPSRADIQVPLSVLGDLRRLGRWFRERPALTEELESRIEDAQQRILDYQIPVYIVETDDEDALRGVFARLNSSGVRMKSDEVFQALLGQRKGQAGALDLAELQKLCASRDFGVPARRDLMKAVIAMSGHDPTRRIDELGEKAAESMVSRTDADAALSSTIEFFQERLAIPHVSLVPYPITFAIIARWFHIFPESVESHLKRLATWFWRTTYTGAHRSSEQSSMRATLGSIDGEDPEETLNTLLNRSTDPAPIHWSLTPFNSMNARSRIEALALFNEKPEDLSGAVSAAELADSGRLSREIIAAGSWSHLTEDARDLANTVANRALMDGPQSGLTTPIREMIERSRFDLLNTHLIDTNCVSHFNNRDNSMFLVTRGNLARQRIEEFLTRMTSSEEPFLRAPEEYSDPSEYPEE